MKEKGLVHYPVGWGAGEGGPTKITHLVQTFLSFPLHNVWNSSAYTDTTRKGFKLIFAPPSLMANEPVTSKIPSFCTISHKTLLLQQRVHRTEGLGTYKYLELFLETKGRVQGQAGVCFQKHQQKRAWEGTGRGTVNIPD